MAADDKKTKPKEKAAPKEKPLVEAPAKDKTAADAATVNDVKAEAKTEAPKNYSRGEGQKPVSQAYKDNWDAIFGKKKKKKKR
jgi:hypothetical protein